MNLIRHVCFENVTPEMLKDLRLRHQELRRTDRYTQLSLLAAERLFADFPPDASTALITATAFGTHRTTFAMLDEILHYPENEILPTKFSHSVLNASAAYIGQVFHCTGPAFALCGFRDVFFEAVSLASVLLSRHIVTRVLVIGCDERALLTDSLPALIPAVFKAPPREAALALDLGTEESKGRPFQLQPREKPTLPSAFFFGASQPFLASLASGGPEPLVLEPTIGIRLPEENLP